MYDLIKTTSFFFAIFAGVWRFWFVSNPRICRLFAQQNVTQWLWSALQRSHFLRRCNFRYGRWRFDSHWKNIPMDRTFLLFIGSLIRKESHPNNRICLWASAHVLEFLLLWPADPCLPIPCWIVLLLCKANRCKYLPCSLWNHQSLLCGKF